MELSRSEPGIEVRKKMNDALQRREETISDENFAKAKDLVKSLNFDLFDEKTPSKVLIGIDPKDYEHVVKSIASRLNFPDHLREAFLENQYTEGCDEKVKEFNFQPGREGTFLFGRLVSVKRTNGKIDLAYSLFYLRFKFSHWVQKRSEPKPGWTGSFRAPNVIHEPKPVKLSEVEKELFQCYLMVKAIKSFQREYSGMLAQS